MAGQAPNYPDILGHITGGERYNIGVVQVAMALRPRVVRAGLPFEVIVLVQNASDVNVDVSAAVQVPDRDAKKKKDRFVTKSARLVIGLEPAEVGYLSLPVSCLADTAISADYKVGMEVKVKPVAKTKPRRIRENEGGGDVDLSHLSEEAVTEIEALKPLHYASSKRSGLRGGPIEIPFGVMSGRVQKMPDLQAGWNSLWTLADHMDDRLLLQKYRETIKGVVLPHLNRTEVFKPLLAQTGKHFKEGGYPLKQIEAFFVTKLLTLILEYAAPSQGEGGAHGYLAAGIYNIEPLLDEERLANDDPIALPAWCSAFLRAVARDDRAARHPVEVITQHTFIHLVSDAINHAFEMIETATGQDLGSAEDRQTYREETLAILEGSSEDSLDFMHAYMPLVLGGIIVYDQVLMVDEKLGDLLQELRTILHQRAHDRNDDTEPIFQIAEELIEQALMKYGYRPK